MYRIRLADETEIPVRWCGESGGVLTASILSELPFLGVAEVFADAEKTRRIVFEYGGMRDVFEGYTALNLINASAAGEYLISLRKG